MDDKELNIKDVIAKTKNFDQPYAPAIPEGIHEVEVIGFEEKVSSNGYKMLMITVSDSKDRIARVNQMLELKWIDGTLRLIKGLFVHNTPETEKESAKEKINKYFESAKDETDLQNKCVEILKKLIEKGCVGWLRVEKEHEYDKYPDRALTAYEPTYRWRVETTIEQDMSNAEPIAVSSNIFDEQ